jgi:hypothetical protein
MDNEHAEKLLIAMGKLTDAIEKLNQRLPQSTGASLPYLPPVDGMIGVEYGKTLFKEALGDDAGEPMI